MRLLRKSLFLFLVGCGISLFFFEEGFSYVLPGRFVLREWAKSSKDIQTFYVEQQTTLFDSNKTFKEQLIFKRPGLFRKKILDGQGEVFYISKGTQSGRIFQGRFESLSLSDSLNPLEFFLIWNEVSQLIQGFQQEGIRVEETRWFLEDNRQIYLEMGKAEGPKWRFSKEGFKPIQAFWKNKKFIFFFSVGGTSSEFYPNKIEVWEGNQLISRTEVISTKSNPSLSSKIFDIDSLLRSVKTK